MQAAVGQDSPRENPDIADNHGFPPFLGRHLPRHYPDHIGPLYPDILNIEYRYKSITSAFWLGEVGVMSGFYPDPENGSFLRVSGVFFGQVGDVGVFPHMVAANSDVVIPAVRSE